MTGIERANKVSTSHGSLEQLLTNLWEEVLEGTVKPDDNFFELGGNSIKAVQVMNRLQEKMNAIFHPASLFDAPTVSRLADYCRNNYTDIFNPTTPMALPVERITNEQIERARQYLLHHNSGANLSANTAARKNHPAIFILSPPRSGSTLLRVILGGSTELFSPPELYLLSFNTLRQRQEHFSGRLDFFREGLLRALMELKDCPQAEAESWMQALEGHGTSTQAFFGLMQQWLGNKRIVDKTPSYAFNPDVLCRAEMEFDNALFIHLVRHPMATIRSYEEIRVDLVTSNRADELPFTPRQKGELWWQISHQNIQSFLETIPQNRQYRLKYEDLVAEPERAVRQLCDFLGIAFSLDMLNPYQEKKQRMTDGVSAVSKIMGDQKFHSYQGIDPTVADRWREKYHEDFLCEASWGIAESLGYPRETFSYTEEREEWEI